MDFWRSLSGTVNLEFTGAEPEKTLAGLTGKQVRLSDIVQETELTYRIRISRRDLGLVIRVLGQRGDAYRIVGKRGLYWLWHGFIHRRILVGLCLLLLAASVYLPSRILFVAVEGNASVPDRLILSAAEECGIRFGASRKTVRSEKVKNALLSAVPRLQWAGINTSGCTALISVRERMEQLQPEQTGGVSSLIADRDGYILSATVTGGTAMVAPGEAVTRGQLLVSGYTDCGICIQATRAKGEILAQTNRKIRAVMPDSCLVPGQISERYYKISLLIGKKRINLWKDSRISDTGCGRMYTEYYFSLPGGFQLPAAICVDRYQTYPLRETPVSEEDARIRLQHFSEDYLNRQMIAGEILRKQQRFFPRGGLYQLDSSFVCTEMIGRERREQIGDMNEQRN